MTKYKANSFFFSIEKVEVTKESNSFVWFSEKDRALKHTRYAKYFDTLEEAKAWLNNIIENELKGLYKNINNILIKSRKIQKLKEL